MVTTTWGAVEEEGNGKGGKSNCNGDKEGNGNDNTEGDCLQV
jgi:hypothetical protein